MAREPFLIYLSFLYPTTNTRTNLLESITSWSRYGRVQGWPCIAYRCERTTVVQYRGKRRPKAAKKLMQQIYELLDGSHLVHRRAGPGRVMMMIRVLNITLNCASARPMQTARNARSRGHSDKGHAPLYLPCLFPFGEVYASMILSLFRSIMSCRLHY